MIHQSYAGLYTIHTYIDIDTIKERIFFFFIFYVYRVLRLVGGFDFSNLHYIFISCGYI